MSAPAYVVRHTAVATTLTVRGALDMHTAPQLADEVERIVADGPAAVQVDLSELDLIDSSGVAALVKLYKSLRASGRDLTVSGVRDQPLAVFKLLRMDRVFDL